MVFHGVVMIERYHTLEVCLEHLGGDINQNNQNTEKSWDWMIFLRIISLEVLVKIIRVPGIAQRECTKREWEKSEDR